MSVGGACGDGSEGFGIGESAAEVVAAMGGVGVDGGLSFHTD